MAHCIDIQPSPLCGQFLINDGQDKDFNMYYMKTDLSYEIYNQAFKWQ